MRKSDELRQRSADRRGETVLGHSDVVYGEEFETDSLHDITVYGHEGRMAGKEMLDNDMFGLDAAGLSAGAPGYDPTSDPASPSYVDPNSVTDPTIPDPSAAVDPNATPSVSLSTAVHKVPTDGVLYDGSKGKPRYAFGSYNYFKGPQGPQGGSMNPGGQFGYVWGYDGMNAPKSTDPRWVKRTGKHGLAPSNLGDGILAFLSMGTSQLAQKDNDNWDDIGSNDLPEPQASSLAAGWGPLIGNPNNSDFANLRYATDDQKWFWFPSEAPAWAMEESNRAIAITNAATAKTLADAQAAQQALDDQTAKQQADAQAAQDAADQIAQQQMATQQSQFDQQQSQAQQQLQTQQAQQQAPLDIQAQQQQMAQQQASFDLEQKAKQADLDYMIAHPETATAAQDSGDEGGDPMDSPDEVMGAVQRHRARRASRRSF
jgi:hypothetical protein